MFQDLDYFLFSFSKTLGLGLFLKNLGLKVKSQDLKVETYNFLLLIFQNGIAISAVVCSGGARFYLYFSWGWQRPKAQT